MRWFVLFLLGCGRIEFVPNPDAATDAPPAPSDCWDAWADGLPPLTPVMPLPEIAAPGIDHDMAETADGLQLYFASDRTGTLGGDDIFVAHRDVRGGPVTQIEHVPSLSSVMNEGAFFTRDGLTGFLAAQLPGGEGNADIWFAERAALDQPFTLTQMGYALVNTPTSDYDAWLSFDGLRLYYSTNGMIAMSTRPTTSDPWSASTAVAGVNAGGEYDPTLTPDERVIVFTSHRLTAERDVFVAVRPDRTSAFQTPVAIPAMATSFADYDPHIAPDGCSIYFASDRDTGGGLLEIYVLRVVR